MLPPPLPPLLLLPLTRDGPELGFEVGRWLFETWVSVLWVVVQRLHFVHQSNIRPLTVLVWGSPAAGAVWRHPFHWLGRPMGRPAGSPAGLP